VCSIMAFDLGIKNSAFALLNGAGKCVYYGMLDNPISNMTDLYNEQVKTFTEELVQIFKDCLELSEPEVVVVERFQPRSFNSGTQCEAVSIMLGLITAHAPCKTAPVVAATWKNWYLRKYGENVAEHILDDPNLYTSHEADAILLGIWYYEVQNSKISKWLQKFFPLKKSCLTCWYRYNGCRGNKNNTACTKYKGLVKTSKCNGCAHLTICKTEVQTEYKKDKINKNTWGCVNHAKKKSTTPA
jgi:hypothetical protein